MAQVGQAMAQVGQAIIQVGLVEMGITPHPKRNREAVTQTRERGIGTAALVANITNPQRNIDPKDPIEDKNSVLHIILLEHKFQD